MRGADIKPPAKHEDNPLLRHQLSPAPFFFCIHSLEIPDGIGDLFICVHEAGDEDASRALDEQGYAAPFADFSQAVLKSFLGAVNLPVKRTVVLFQNLYARHHASHAEGIPAEGTS